MKNLIKNMKKEIKEKEMKKYKVRIRRANGTKIELEADAVSVSGNRIGFHRDGEATLWTKIDNVEVDRVVMV